jgi:diguanylate cyclase
LGELDQALFNHDMWSEALNRTLICRLTPDQADLAADAHKRCRFGQWLYGSNGKSISSHPGMTEVLSSHERMHRFGGELLAASSRGATITLSDYERFVTSLKQLRLEIHTIKHELEDAIYNLDPLTGAANRIGMLTKLREQRALVERKVHFCCVAMFDLDNFRGVNERHGHGAGDSVLVAFARQGIVHLRPYDTLFRYGGEEFLLCLPDTDMKEGVGIVDRLRLLIGEQEFKDEHGMPFHVTVSAGVTLLDPDVSVEESIQRADKALYAAKAAGRNCVKPWDVSMT